MAKNLEYFLKLNTNLDGNQLKDVVKCFKTTTVKRNTILLSGGEICKELYFVSYGCIRTYYLTKQGYEKTRHIAFDNSIATSISSFISQQPSFEFVDALEDSGLFVINREDFYQLVADIPQWEKFYRELLESAYIYQNKKIEELVTLSARQRYDKLIKENPYYAQRLSNRILATCLDITPETLSRLKSQ